MKPDFDRAAILASETLIKYEISVSPIYPIHILNQLPGVVSMSFAEIAAQMGTDRDRLLESVGNGNQDAITIVNPFDTGLFYLIVYNQRLPLFLIQRALARELGHIVMEHDGSRPTDVRMMEAQTFAYHLICPRAIIRAIQESDVPLTTEVLGNYTGCYERCLAGMKKTPGVCVPAEMNRIIKKQFAESIRNFLLVQRQLPDESRIADFGTYMDGYEE